MQIVEPRRRARRSGELHATCVFATMLVAAPDAKKPRTGEIVPSGGGGTLATSGPARTSELLAPIMLLTGHTGPVLTCKFSPDGQHVMTGSHDRLMLLWNTFGECENTLTLRGHRNAILELHWASDGEAVFSASADKTVAMWDAKTGARTRQFKGHTSHVNSCCPSADAHVVASVRPAPAELASPPHTHSLAHMTSHTHPWLAHPPHTHRAPTVAPSRWPVAHLRVRTTAVPGCGMIASASARARSRTNSR